MNRTVLRGIVLLVLAGFVLAAMLWPGRKIVRHGENLDPWVLVSYTPDTHYGCYLGNGLISTRLLGDGAGSEGGAQLPCFVAGLYNDEKLTATPTWSDLRFYDGRTQFVLDSAQDYRQSLDMRTGILTTQATWRAGDKTLKGTIQVMALRHKPNVGVVVAEVVPDFDGGFSADTIIGPPGSGLTPQHLDITADSSRLTECYRTRDGKLYLGFSICHGAGRTWVVKRRGTARSLSESINANRGKAIKVESFAALAVGPTEEQATDAAGAALSEAPAAGYLEAHKAAWSKLWQKDIVIGGPRQDQQVIHSCMFYLLESVREGSEWSIPPMGLSNDAFNGHVFWDADVWMFPALILQHPELARSIVDYRHNTLPGAMANAKADGFSGAEYAWESGCAGREDIQPGLVYKNERHIDGDVALAQWQYYLATGEVKWLKDRGYPVIEATADYWLSRAKLVKDKEQGDRYEILRVVPPDENADLVDNNAYTNVIAKMNLRIAVAAAKMTGADADPRWSEVASKMYVPYDAAKQRFAAFDGYRGIEAKQADTELLIYPLQYKIDAADMIHIYKNTFSFYAPRVMKNGPAMTSSAESVIAARLGEGAVAYSCFGKKLQAILAWTVQLLQ